MAHTEQLLFLFYHAAVATATTFGEPDRQPAVQSVLCALLLIYGSPEKK